MARKFELTEGENEILREPVIAWAVVEDTHESEDGGPEREIFGQPIVAPSTDDRGETPFGTLPVPDIFVGDQILGVVPDQFQTRRISALIDIGGEERLVPVGYEYHGATTPDWDTVIANVQAERRREQQQEDR